MSKINEQMYYWTHMLDEAYSHNDLYKLDDHIQEAAHAMHGPAYARKTGGIDEIADMRQKLASGIVEFEFWKHGETGGNVLRHAVGTTNERIIPVAERRRLDPNYDDNVASYERRSGFIIWFWDLEKNQVRCFNTNRFDRIINYVETDNITRHGNIFIHRDEDTDMQTVPDRITADAAEEITHDMMSDIRDDDFNISDFIGFNGNQNGGVVIDTVNVTSGNNQEPVLKIVISKRGTDNDAPYQLRINDLRNAIREKYNVNIRRVEITGTFIF